MTPYIVGNWKMNGTQAAAAALATGLIERAKADAALPHMVVCPPYPYLGLVKEIVHGSPIKLGAQDCAAEAKGAYTGDVSAPMVADVGCQYVIIGHSERRQYHDEAEGLIRKKLAASLEADLTPILCIGESEAAYRAGQTLDVLAQQLEGMPSSGILIAYEPVWAIGTGMTPTPQEVEDVAAFIKDTADVPVLYGGSANASNARAFLSQPSIDGLLVGGASLDADSFWQIIKAAS